MCPTCNDKPSPGAGGAAAGMETCRKPAAGPPPPRQLSAIEAAAAEAEAAAAAAEAAADGPAPLVALPGNSELAASAEGSLARADSGDASWDAGLGGSPGCTDYGTPASTPEPTSVEQESEPEDGSFASGLSEPDQGPLSEAGASEADASNLEPSPQGTAGRQRGKRGPARGGHTAKASRQPASGCGGAHGLEADPTPDGHQEQLKQGMGARDALPRQARKRGRRQASESDSDPGLDFDEPVQLNSPQQGRRRVAKRAMAAAKQPQPSSPLQGQRRVARRAGEEVEQPAQGLESKAEPALGARLDVNRQARRGEAKHAKAATEQPAEAAGGDLGGFEPGLALRAQLAAALKVVTRVARSAAGAPFAAPVDAALAPGYEQVVECPMDLSNIAARLRAGTYASLGAAQWSPAWKAAPCLILCPAGSFSEHPCALQGALLYYAHPTGQVCPCIMLLS